MFFGQKTQEKGTLFPEKGHLAKLGGGGLAPHFPPGSYAPVSAVCLFQEYNSCLLISTS
jgi:hypothetical protein